MYYILVDGLVHFFAFLEDACTAWLAFTEKGEHSYVGVIEWMEV